MQDWKKMLRDIRAGVGAGRTTGSTRHEVRGLEADPPRRPAKAVRHVCIGLDFGTSSTKVVIQLLPNGPAFAAPIGSGGGEERYLAPTRLWVAEDGTVSLDMNGTGGWVEDLKGGLMEWPWDQLLAVKGVDVRSRPADLAATYVALVLRSTLDWFREEISPKLGEVEIAWSMNLGIPARDFDAATIREAFLAVARAGWSIAHERGVISLAQGRRAVDATKEGPFFLNGAFSESIEVVPEVAAGVTAYARSPQRQAGVHLFVDVGATTVDSSMFLLNATEEGLKYVFLSADVDSQLGALRLHRHRASELGRLALERFAASNPLKPIPATALECIPPIHDVEMIDSSFIDRCAISIGRVLYLAKLKAPSDISVQEGDPNGRVEVLLSGGGTRLPLYREVVDECGRRAAPGGRQGLRARQFRIDQIPQPANLSGPGLTPETWQRLAIAFGLSYRFEDIGEFVPPSAIPAMPPSVPRQHEPAFVSKDQV